MNKAGVHPDSSFGCKRYESCSSIPFHVALILIHLVKCCEKVSDFTREFPVMMACYMVVHLKDTIRSDQCVGPAVIGAGEILMSQPAMLCCNLRSSLLSVCC